MALQPGPQFRSTDRPPAFHRSSLTESAKAGYLQCFQGLAALALGRREAERLLPRTGVIVAHAMHTRTILQGGGCSHRLHFLAPAELYQPERSRSVSLQAGRCQEQVQ